MKSHVWRPLFVVIGIIVLVLVFRIFYVPKEFGVWERGYMYGWHNRADEDFWKNFQVKYNFNSTYCRDCHPQNYDSIMQTPHAIINCENCHGPALNHPAEPPKLQIDKSRAQCLRCHFPLAYPSSGRANIRGIDPDQHNPDIECAMCHNPHNPGLGVKKTGGTKK